MPVNAYHMVSILVQFFDWKLQWGGGARVCLLIAPHSGQLPLIRPAHPDRV